MWISGRDSDGPHRPVWTGWKTPPHLIHLGYWDNLGYNYRMDDETVPLSWARRPRWEKYDFRARKYRMPRPGTWSDVKWNDHPRFPLYHRDQNGDDTVAPEFDGGAFNEGWGENPFRYKHHTPIWDWYV